MATGREPAAGFEPVIEEAPAGPPANPPRASTALTLAAVVVLLLVALSWVSGTGRSDADPDETEVDPGTVPVDRDDAKDLLDSIGGVDALVLGTAEGAFDLVSFDPSDPDHLLASKRSSYGPARNEAANEEWFVADGDVVQTLFAPSRPHDFAHFTADGSVAVWVHSGSSPGFASRRVEIDGPSGTSISAPVHASRFVVEGDTLFALTGDDDYYAADRSFQLLIADRDGAVTILGDGAAFSWVDAPMAGAIVAYPATPDAVIAVWHRDSLEQWPDHPLAGRDYERMAVSGDGRTAVGILGSGEMEVFDPVSGARGARFGSVDPEGIARPVTLNHEGTIAVTVARQGEVGIWWVGDDRPLALIEGDAGAARVVAEYRGALASSVVAPDARRVAVRTLGTGRLPMSWRFLDIDIESWIDRAAGGGAPP